MTSQADSQGAGAFASELEQMPSPPYVAIEIVRLTRDPDSSVGDLAAVLRTDPVLAARLLRCANSPAYGLTQEVATIDRATMLLGLKAVRMMALSFSLTADVGDDVGALDLATYWRNSLLSAVAGRRWAELMARSLTEEAFLAGLLAHLGRLMMARHHAEAYGILVAASPIGWPTVEEEYAAFGFTSADVTDAVLAAWGLPSVIAGSLARLNGVAPDRDQAPGAVQLAAVLRMVGLTNAALRQGATADDVARLETAARDVGLTPEATEGVILELEVHLRDLAETLEVELTHEHVSHQDLIDEARLRLVSESMAAAADLQTAQRTADELRVENAELDQKAHIDALTGVPNRGVFNDHLDRTIAGIVRRGAGGIGLLMFDIDHFKRFNDTHGHQIGDEVLRAVAKTMETSSRTNELFARYGGEEFVLVLGDCQAGDVLIAGERLRKAVEQVRVPSPAGDLSVTVSAGAAYLELVGDRDAAERLTKLADEALYQAKRSGRNRVCGLDT